MKKEEQKQHLIDMMRYDENLGLYKEEKQETTLEEAAERYAHNYFNMHETNNYKALKQGYEAGAKEMAERMYSEEEVKHIISEALQSALVTVDLEQWFKQFKKK